MLSEEVAKCAHVLFHSEIGDITSIARENLRLRQLRARSFFIGIAKEEFARLEWGARAGCGFHSRALDGRLREPIAVAKVFVSVIEWRDSFQVEGGKKLNSIILLHMALVLLSAAFTFGDVAGEQIWQ